MAGGIARVPASSRMFGFERFPAVWTPRGRAGWGCQGRLKSAPPGAGGQLQPALTPVGAEFLGARRLLPTWAWPCLALRHGSPALACDVVRSASVEPVCSWCARGGPCPQTRRSRLGQLKSGGGRRGQRSPSGPSAASCEAVLLTPAHGGASGARLSDACRSLGRPRRSTRGPDSKRRNDESR